MASFHPSQDLLVDYATGALQDPFSLMIATHLALCPECRHEARRLEAVGGALLQEIPPTALRPDALERIMARLDEEPDSARPIIAPQDPFEGRVPEPLRSRLAGSAWRKVSKGIDEIVLPTETEGVTAQLLRIRAGCKVPRHSHQGNEYTLVLAGGFSDHVGRFGPGDLTIADSTLTHSPVADADQDCYCLAIVDGGLRLPGPLGRVLSLFWRI
ncbi:MAG: ChrR family anti-sigma-E factor [Elsteraceae bacterium]